MSSPKTVDSALKVKLVASPVLRFLALHSIWGQNTCNYTRMISGIGIGQKRRQVGICRAGKGTTPSRRTFPQPPLATASTEQILFTDPKVTGEPVERVRRSSSIDHRAEKRHEPWCRLFWRGVHFFFVECLPGVHEKKKVDTEHFLVQTGGDAKIK